MVLRLTSSLILFALIFVIYAAKGDREEAIKRGDAYIDKLLEDISKNKVEEYDPYRIEDSSVGFHKKVVFVNVTGEAKLFNGYIKGLSTLHRPEHCSLQEKNDRLKVKAELGAGELEFHYSGSVKFMNFGPTITVEGILDYVQVYMEFTVDSKTGKNGTLDDFVIDDMRGMKVRVTGLGPLNWAVNPIIKGVTKVFKRFVKNFMENKVEKYIANRIPNYQFPVEGGEETAPPEPETEPTTEPTTVPTETNLPTESQTNTQEPETVTPEPETIRTEEPETVPPEPETNSPEEPETIEPETNPPEEPETAVPNLEIIPPKEPEVHPPEPEEFAFLEPEHDISNDFHSGVLMSSEDELDSNDNMLAPYDPEDAPNDKYVSFVEE